MSQSHSTGHKPVHHKKKAGLKRFHGAFWLLATLFVLGGVATWDEWQTKKEDTEKKTANKLITIDVDAATEMEFDSRGVDTAGSDTPAAPPVPGHQPFGLKLAKKDGQWWVTSPINALADQEMVKSLLKAFSEYKYDKVVAETRDREKEFGLDPALRTVKLVAGGDAVTIYIGDKAPVDYNVYVRTDKNNQILIGSQYLLVATGKTFFEFRDKAMVSIDEKTIKSLHLASAGLDGTFEVVRQGEAFAITKPQAVDTDSGQVKTFVTDLGRLRANEFVDTPDKELLKAFASKPFVSVSWENADGTKHQLTVVDLRGKLYGRVGDKGQIFGIAEDSRKKLVKTTADFRNRKIFTFSGEKVVSMEIDGEKFKKVKGDFHPEAMAEKAANLKVGDVITPKYYVRSLLVDLEFAQAEEFYGLNDKDVTKATANAPKHRMVIGFDDAAQSPITVDVWPYGDKPTGKTEPEKYYLKHTNGKYIYRVGKTILANIKPSEERGGPAPVSGGGDGESADGEGTEPLDVSGLGGTEPVGE